MTKIKVTWFDRFQPDDRGGEKTDFNSVDEAIAYCQEKVDDYFEGQPSSTWLQSLSNKKRKNKNAIKSAIWNSYIGFSTSYYVVADGKIKWTDEEYARTKWESVMSQFHI